MLWKVWFYHFGEEVKTYITADTFDEAIDIARCPDMRYSTAQPVNNKED